MLLEPQDTPAGDFLFDQGGVEDQFHAVGAGTHGERLPGKALPTGRWLEPVEPRLSRDFLQGPLASTAMAACRICTRAWGEMPNRVSVLSSSSLARRVRSAMSVAAA